MSNSVLGTQTRVMRGAGRREGTKTHQNPPFFFVEIVAKYTPLFLVEVVRLFRASRYHHEKEPAESFWMLVFSSNFDKIERGSEPVKVKHLAPKFPVFDS